MVIVTVVDYRHYDRFAYFLYAGCMALLILTLAVAEETRGARAWPAAVESASACPVTDRMMD